MNEEEESKKKRKEKRGGGRGREQRSIKDLPKNTTNPKSDMSLQRGRVSTPACTHTHNTLAPRPHVRAPSVTATKLAHCYAREQEKHIGNKEQTYSEQGDVYLFTSCTIRYNSTPMKNAIILQNTTKCKILCACGVLS